MGFPPVPGGKELGRLASMAIGVLIIDDDPRFREAASQLLKRQGLEVAGQAGNIQTARRLIADDGVEAALIDIHLPDGNGADLAGELNAQRPGLRVLLTSSDADVADADQVAESGAIGFVAKTALAQADLSGLFLGRRP
jgi:DNA-binding NarL/FixJ family response regulator